MTKNFNKITLDKPLHLWYNRSGAFLYATAHPCQSFNERGNIVKKLTMPKRLNCLVKYLTMSQLLVPTALMGYPLRGRASEPGTTGRQTHTAHKTYRHIHIQHTQRHTAQRHTIGTAHRETYIHRQRDIHREKSTAYTDRQRHTHRQRDIHRERSTAYTNSIHT